jgi:hypothetical protein
VEEKVRDDGDDEDVTAREAGGHVFVSQNKIQGDHEDNDFLIKKVCG